MLKPLTRKEESLIAFERFKQTMETQTEIYKDIRLGYRGSVRRYDIHWNTKLRLWCYFGVSEDRTRYWCPFGVDDPSGKDNVPVVVEVNPPCSGINLNIGGAFVRGLDDRIYVAHSGKIGGGRKGVGKTAFVEFYREGNWKDVDVPDGRQTKMILLGPVDKLELREAVAQFTCKVREFKDEITRS